MVETGDDDNAGEWRLLASEFKFVLGLTERSESFAAQLLRTFLQGGERDRQGRSRYRVWQLDARPGPAPSPNDGAFWHSDSELGITCKIDFWNSSAVWTGPASDSWKQQFGRQMAEYRVAGIYLRHEVLVEFLQGAGFLPLPEQPAQTGGSASEKDAARIHNPAEPAQPTPTPPTESSPPVQPTAKPNVRELQRWVFGQCDENPPADRDPKYADDLLERCPFTVGRKTIQNYMSLWRKEQRAKKREHQKKKREAS